MSLFGIIVSGRLVQTDFQQVDTTKFLITIPNADSINHIVVFLTGAQPLPSDMGAAVHFSWPDQNAPPTWRYLGLVCNDKPSAIFKITQNHSNGFHQNGFGFTQPIVSHVAQIGISIEPLEQLRNQTPQTNGCSDVNNVITPQYSNGQLVSTNGHGPNSFAHFVTKTAENLFNYVASFSRQIPNAGSEQFVPLNSIRDWYNSFQRRIQLNPDFWKD